MLMKKNGLICWFTFLPYIIQAQGDTISFNRDVRPIISKTCFSCHGPDDKHLSGELQLSNLSSAQRGGESGEAAIVPGDASASKMIRRIFSEDPDLKMPPPEFHTRLTDEEKQILKVWIDQGAKYEKHWAFIAPQKHPVPAMGRSGSSNPIDCFIEARLAREAKILNDRSDLHGLVRRLFLDLTGLPPNLNDLDQVTSFDQVNGLIDKLLESPHFGERMAVDWMDVSRYADTHGYSRDGTRHMWLWRDYVIKSFNENKPYDRFIMEQIAGDLIEDATDEQLIATGFNRLHPITQEGGTIPEENLTNYVVDRVKTTSEGILGVTMACAQCHDHKYDPISQKEYYQFFAFFNGLSDKGIDGNEGRNAKPVHQAYSPLRDLDELNDLREEKRILVAALEKRLPEAQRAWESQLIAELQTKKTFSSVVLNPISASHPHSHRPVKFEENGRCRVAVAKGNPINISFEIPHDFGMISGLRFRAIPLGEDVKASYGGEKDFGLKSLSASFSETISPTVDLNALEKFSKVTASSTKDWTNPPSKAFQPLEEWLSCSDPGEEVEITGMMVRPLDASHMRYLTLELCFPNDNRPGMFQVEVFKGDDPTSAHPPGVVKVVSKTSDERTQQEHKELKDYFQEISEVKSSLRVAINNVNMRIDYHAKKHQAMVMDEAPEPRKTHVLNRGIYSDKLEEVHAGTPKVFPVLVGHQKKLNRLDLAKWFFDPNHPTTARVAVNRIWSLFFGRGLSESLSDFGSQGTYPSHPELLDWLSVEFRESGWDIKKMVRLMVSSSVYQQSSIATTEQLKCDPHNELLSRGPRFRLQAEFIRDLFLESSGLMNEDIGGPSVNPYQPGDLWREISHFGSVGDPGQTFFQDVGDNLYRRSLYTFWKRTLPPPNMTAFDAPNREVCSVGRSSTNTPSQALVLLNDPQFVEAARVLATEIMELEKTQTQKIRSAFRTVTAQEPDERQLSVLEEHLNGEINYFNRHPDRAVAYLSVGDKISEFKKVDSAELAAWTNLASLIFNLSQTITRY